MEIYINGEVKDVEVIENPNEYIEILGTLKNFNVLYSDVFNYDKFLNPHFKR